MVSQSPPASSGDANGIELGALHQSPFGSPHHSTRSGNSSLRSSLDEQHYETQDCVVHIYDDVPCPEAVPQQGPPIVHEAYSRHKVPPLTGHIANPILQRGGDSTAQFMKRLHDRDHTRTRWINIVGWSQVYVDAITNTYLGNHGCLGLEGISKNVMGGPIRVQDDQELIWLQTDFWSIGKRARLWSSM